MALVLTLARVALSSARLGASRAANPTPAPSVRPVALGTCEHAEAMRIVIDLRWMRPGLAGGIENLSRSFLGELLLLDRTNSYRVLLPAAVAHDFDLRHRPNFRFEPVDGPGQVWRRWSARMQRRWHGDGPRQHAPGPDAVLSLSGYIRPDMFSHRNVLVFTDLQHEYHPEFFAPEQLEERRRVFGTSIAKAERMIAISEHTRESVLKHYRVSPERVATGHLAADPVFHPERWRAADLPRVMQKYGLEAGGYLIFPANTWHHKNHPGAFEALALLRDTHARRVMLVLTCLLYTSPSPRDRTRSRMPSSA